MTYRAKCEARRERTKAARRIRARYRAGFLLRYGGAEVGYQVIGGTYDGRPIEILSTIDRNVPTIRVGDIPAELMWGPKS